MSSLLKKTMFIISLLVLSVTLVACGGETMKELDNENQETIGLQEKTDEKRKIKIGCMAITEPIIQFLSEGLEDQGYVIEPVLFDGNHLPATSLKDGNIDGVILNHLVWLDTFNKENDAKLVMPEPYMYFFRNAMYSTKHKKLEDIPKGATIAVPGDPANLDRSLRILDELGLIKLGDKTGNFYSLVDIEDNIKDIKILETEITATTRSMDDVDAIISGANAVKDAGYDHNKFLYDDQTNEDYPLGLIISDEDQNADWVKAILEYQQTDEFKKMFDKRYDQTYVLFR